MLSEGEEAPRFDLPAAVDGDVQRVSLEEYVGEDIVILAFYPGDFNPVCDGETTDLDELDLFTMQKDVSILAISADSVYSHLAFAETYDLHIPLLADVQGEVAAAYGVRRGQAETHLTRRAVVVIDHRGEVEYAWAAEDVEELHDVGAVREAVDDVGGDDTAEARYRVGYAHYMEGRRAFTSAMNGFAEKDWMMAQGDFTRAHEEFAESADEFNTAVRFAEDETAETYFDRAEEKAQALWQAAEWLAEAASAYASGEGREGQSLRSDAEKPLETARRIHEPIDPDEFPPEEDPAERQEQHESILPTDDEEIDTTLDLDEDALDTAKATESADGDQTAAETADGPAGSDGVASETAAEPGQVDVETVANDAEPDEGAADSIDDEELEEIAAELEEQTAAAQAAETGEPADRGLVPDQPGSESGVEPDAAEANDGTGDEEGIELDLTDPTEEEVDPVDDEMMDAGDGEEGDVGADGNGANGDAAMNGDGATDGEAEEDSEYGVPDSR